MNLFQRIAQLFRGGPTPTSNRFFPIYVLSRRCNEPIAGQLDLLNELSLDEDDAYYGRKVLHTTGERRCFDQVEVLLWFDRSKQLLRHEVQGGRWLEADEYEAELARFNAPPAEETNQTT
jgi:hypothetical protein